MCVLQRIIILTIYCNFCVLSSKIVFVNILYRHGARTPLFFYPTDPHKDYPHFLKLGLGQLTDIGKKQHIKLGEYLRNKYPDLLTDPKYVHVQATEDKRVRESATCNLAAMFPDFGEHSEDKNGVHCSTKVPIEVVPKDKDNVLQMQAPCLAYKTELLAEGISAAFLAIAKAGIRGMLDTLYEFAGLGKKLANLEYVYKIYDTLKIEGKDYNLTLPTWTKGIYPEPLKKAVVLGFSVPTWDDKLKRLGPGPLLKQMIENMEKKIDKKTELNANIYAAHDITIVNLLNTLGVFDGEHLPGYAACVMLELWLDDKNQYYVKLRYKLDPDAKSEELDPLKCGSPCRLEDFKEKCKKYLPTDWKSECHFHSPSSQY